jgi:amino acid adenylation domain-containing protein
LATVAPNKIRGLAAGFAKSVERYADRPALLVDRELLSYAELLRRAGSLAGAIRHYEIEKWPLTALLAYRSVTAYAGVMGILSAGKGYVPLNPKFPVARSRAMLLLSGCSTLIVGPECVSLLHELLVGVDRNLVVILPMIPRNSLPADFPRHRFVSSNEIDGPSDSFDATEVEPNAVAYLLFTSGSTGVPKGVPIHHRNVRPYVEYVANRYQVAPEDRFSQHFDQTFDLSVHDMFVAWESGSSLFCVPEQSLIAPAKFIREHELTMWFSVPSVIGMLSRLHLLSPNSFPSLRYSLFCGEPLTATCARQWQEAAGNSIVENLYGPTETTIAITHYRWNSQGSPEECVNGVVPIGWPFANQKVILINGERKCVPAGENGELCLSGSQVTNGYWNNPEKTREQFVTLPEMRDTLWYRTGDLVRQDDRGCLYYQGRLDRQVKIRGYRVELMEIEAVLRKICGTEQVVSLPLPSSTGSSDGVVAFVSSNVPLDPGGIIDSCSEFLPAYMVPKRIYPMAELPLNTNGKVDLPKLAKILKAMQT